MLKQHFMSEYGCETIVFCKHVNMWSENRQNDHSVYIGLLVPHPISKGFCCFWQRMVYQERYTGEKDSLHPPKLSSNLTDICLNFHWPVLPGSIVFHTALGGRFNDIRNAQICTRVYMYIEIGTLIYAHNKLFRNPIRIINVAHKDPYP